MNNTKHYLGVVSEIIDTDDISKEYGIVKVNIPGILEEVQAFPKRSEIDFPVIGETVILTSLDPIYNSILIYEKIKEDDFIGFRAAGKMVDITPDSITIGVFDGEVSDQNPRPECKTKIKLFQDGCIEISSDNSSLNIQVKGDITLDTEGDINLGGGAVHNLIKGDLFKALFNSHTHPESNTPPTIQMTDDILSNKTFTE